MKKRIIAHVNVEDDRYTITIEGFGVAHAGTIEDVHASVVNHIVQRGGSTADVRLDWAAVLERLREYRWGLHA